MTKYSLLIKKLDILFVLSSFLKNQIRTLLLANHHCFCNCFLEFHQSVYSTHKIYLKHHHRVCFIMESI